MSSILVKGNLHGRCHQRRSFGTDHLHLPRQNHHHPLGLAKQPMKQTIGGAGANLLNSALVVGLRTRLSLKLRQQERNMFRKPGCSIGIAEKGMPQPCGRFRFCRGLKGELKMCYPRTFRPTEYPFDQRPRVRASTRGSNISALWEKNNAPANHHLVLGKPVEPLPFSNKLTDHKGPLRHCGLKNLSACPLLPSGWPCPGEAPEHRSRVSDLLWTKRFVDVPATNID